MTEEDIRRIVKEVFCELKKERHSFWIDAELHYQDHLRHRGFFRMYDIAARIVLALIIGGLATVAGWLAMLWSKGVGK